MFKYAENIYNSLAEARGSKCAGKKPRKRRSLGVFDILKRSHSDLISRDCQGKLHSTSFHRIKEVVQSLSEVEKDALKERAVDLSVAMSHLYANMSAEMAMAEEVNSDVPIEGLFILKRGNTLYYHGTNVSTRLRLEGLHLGNENPEHESSRIHSEHGIININPYSSAKRLLDLQHEEYVKDRSNNIFTQLQSYVMLKEAVCPMAPTVTVNINNSFPVGSFYVLQLSAA
ncbi:hypothetical protein V1508DRAFT_399946 [Lipomyces doorenjongii]|uniref:uncharacterized protein n=1 Tax=Lipomyces doorenjongii TaxID=383834 RepID=UPI0034D00E02